MKKKIFSSLQFKYWLIAQGIVIIIYHGTMLITPFKAVELPMTYVDRLIGFYSFFTYIYVSFFLQLFIAVVYTDEDISLKCAGAIVLNACIAAPVFYFFPTTMTAAFFNEGHLTSHFMSVFIRSLDKNYNCFPSIHIANSLVATVYFNVRRSKPWRMISILWFVLITWSVISTRQHYFIDVIGGLMVAVTSMSIINRKMFRNQFDWIKK